jgi:hypothetical protein
MEKAYVWEAWIGQKIVRCQTSGDTTTIVLEDGRGIQTQLKDTLWFTVKSPDSGQAKE